MKYRVLSIAIALFAGHAATAFEPGHYHSGELGVLELGPSAPAGLKMKVTGANEVTVDLCEFEGFVEPRPIAPGRYRYRAAEGECAGELQAAGDQVTIDWCAKANEFCGRTATLDTVFRKRPEACAPDRVAKRHAEMQRAPALRADAGAAVTAYSSLIEECREFFGVGTEAAIQTDLARALGAIGDALGCEVLARKQIGQEGRRVRSSASPAAVAAECRRAVLQASDPTVRLLPAGLSPHCTREACGDVQRGYRAIIVRDPKRARLGVVVVLPDRTILALGLHGESLGAFSEVRFDPDDAGRVRLFILGGERARTYRVEPTGLVRE